MQWSAPQEDAAIGAVVPATTPVRLFHLCITAHAPPRFQSLDFFCLFVNRNVKVYDKTSTAGDTRLLGVVSVGIGFVRPRVIIAYADRANAKGGCGGLQVVGGAAIEARPFLRVIDRFAR